MAVARQYLPHDQVGDLLQVPQPAAAVGADVTFAIGQQRLALPALPAIVGVARGQKQGLDAAGL